MDLPPRPCRGRSVAAESAVPGRKGREPAKEEAGLRGLRPGAVQQVSGIRPGAQYSPVNPPTTKITAATIMLATTVMSEPAMAISLMEK